MTSITGGFTWQEVKVLVVDDPSLCDLYTVLQVYEEVDVMTFRSAGEIQRALEAGFDHYLTKLMDVEKIISMQLDLLQEVR